MRILSSSPPLGWVTLRARPRPWPGSWQTPPTRETRSKGHLVIEIWNRQRVGDLKLLHSLHCLNIDTSTDIRIGNSVYEKKINLLFSIRNLKSWNVIVNHSNKSGKQSYFLSHFWWLPHPQLHCHGMSFFVMMITKKNLFVSPRRCYHILSFTSQSLLRHTFSQRLHKHITEEVTKFILKLLCMTLLQDSSLLVGVDSWFAKMAIARLTRWSS